MNVWWRTNCRIRVASDKVSEQCIFNYKKRKMKKIIFLVAVVLIGGVCIWSCSQDDELENGGALYRYTDKELAEIRSLAEKYGLEDVSYVTEADFELPTIDEMEETFKTFAIIKSCEHTLLSLTDSTENSKVFQSNRKPYARILKRALETTTAGCNISKDVNLGEITAKLNVTVSVKYTQSDKDELNPYPTPVVTLSAHINLSELDQLIGYKVENEYLRYSLVDNNKRISIYYDCEVNCYKTVLEGSVWMEKKVSSVPFSFFETVTLNQ